MTRAEDEALGQGTAVGLAALGTGSRGQPRATHPYAPRGRIGRISFSGADADGSPWTQTAIAQAHRAVQEQLEV